MQMLSDASMLPQASELSFTKCPAAGQYCPSSAWKSIMQVYLTAVASFFGARPVRFLAASAKMPGNARV